MKPRSTPNPLPRCARASMLVGLLAAGCASSPSANDTQRILDQIPDQTTVDPATGCRYIKDDKHPEKPQPCRPNGPFPTQKAK